MKYVRLLVFSFLLLFLVIWGLSLFIPSRVRISRAVDIYASREAVWNEVDDMRKWKTWNPFFKDLDVAAVKELDTTGGSLRAMEARGTTISWDKIQPDEHIAAMRREGKNPVYNGWKCISSPGSDSCTVQWYMDFNLSWYPWEKFASLTFERSYGPQMEAGLSNLKKIAESYHSSTK